ncbi:MAG TPA: CBS domain-containing protein [Clostridia bacterium]|nr:CBS domain-containing protein [Clostridia bacterium]
MQLSERQEQIVKIVQEQGPIIGEDIAAILGVVRSTLRSDFAFLTKSGFLGARPRVGYYFTGKKIYSHIVEAIRKLKVKDWQAVPVVVGEEATVYDAIVNLFLNDVGTLYIVSEGGILEGVVSRKDLLKIVLGQADIQKIPINIIMTRMPNIVTISPEESLWSAAKKLVEHEVDSLPVVKPVFHKGREGLEVIGRVTKTTITSAFVHVGQNKYEQEEKE